MPTAEELAEKRELARLESMPMLRDLQDAGVLVEDVWDIKHPDHYPECIPVIINYLDADFDPNVFSGMAQKLSVPEIVNSWDLLLAGYESQPDDGKRGSIANAIAKFMNKDRYESVRRVLLNADNGKSRLVILRDVKKKFRGALGRELLEELVNDPDIGWLAKEKLGKK